MVSITELRQQLYKLADAVIDTGEPLIIERRGVRLKLMREEAPAAPQRLARLQTRDLVIGAPLAPEESPAQWSELALSKVAEKSSAYAATTTRKRERR